MPIKFKCNSCGQDLTVKDELAGRSGKCPACKSAMTVPALTTTVKPARSAPAKTRSAPAQEEVWDGDIVAEEAPAKPQKKAPANGQLMSLRQKRVVEDEVEEVEDAVEEVEEDDKRRPAKSKQEKKQEFAFDDDEEDDEDEDEPKRKKKPKKKFRAAGSVNTEGAVALGIGAAVLVLLGLTTVFDFWYVQITLSPEMKNLVQAFGGKEADVGQPDTAIIDNWRGVMILTASILAAVASGAALIVVMSSKDGQVSDNLVGGASAVGAGWAAVVLLWNVGWMLKWMIHTLPHNGQEFFGMKISVYPGIGLGLGLCVPFGVMGVYYFAAAARERLTWMMAGAGAGLFMGFILLMADVRPWSQYTNMNFYEKRSTYNTGGGFR